MQEEEEKIIPFSHKTLDVNDELLQKRAVGEEDHHPPIFTEKQTSQKSLNIDLSDPFFLKNSHQTSQEQNPDFIKTFQLKNKLSQSTSLIDLSTEDDNLNQQLPPLIPQLQPAQHPNIPFFDSSKFINPNYNSTNFFDNQTAISNPVNTDVISNNFTPQKMSDNQFGMFSDNHATGSADNLQKLNPSLQIGETETSLFNTNFNNGMQGIPLTSPLEPLSSVPANSSQDILQPTAYQQHPATPPNVIGNPSSLLFNSNVDPFANNHQNSVNYQIFSSNNSKAKQLIEIGNIQSSSFILDPKILALPTKKWLDVNIFSDIQRLDPIQDLIAKFFTLSERPQRKLLKFEDVQNLSEEAAFSKLFAAGSFRAAAQLVRSKIVNRSERMHPGKPDEICRLWYIRLLCLVQLKCWETAQYEMEKLGIYLEKDIDPAISVEQLELKSKNVKNPVVERPWTFESYPDIFPNRKGSMVSFELRNFHALWPSLKGNPQDSLNRLYSLVFICRKNSLNAKPQTINESINDSNFWITDSFLLWRIRELRLHLQIASCLVDLKQFKLSTQILTKVSNSVNRLTEKSIPMLTSVLQKFKIDTISAIGRCHLQSGNVAAAEVTFHSLERLLLGPDVPRIITNEKKLRVSRSSDMLSYRDPQSQANIDQKPPANFFDFPRLLLNRALLYLAIGENEIAANYFTALVTVEPSGMAVNNLAVAKLYTGDVGQAISFLESICVEKPNEAGICENLIFNLCTL
ncbi:Trafficking protein particle complex subunit 12, partial [Clydaea vesicula]